MPVTAARRCVHCGLDGGPAPLQLGGNIFCCAGCAAVWDILHAEGLGRFYEAGALGSTVRRPSTEVPRGPIPVLDALEAAGEAHLDVAGMRCASCAWLIERYLGGRAGVADVRVSYATATCRLRWDRDRTSLAHLLAELDRIGYRARPSNPKLRLVQSDRDDRMLLVRTGVSAFLAMNVMMAATALYAGGFQGMNAGVRDALRALSALLAAPVVVYGGWPFLRGAMAALRARQATMDTLVALGAATAFGASLYGLAGGGPVYFDTAAMIVTLVLVGRLVESAARRRSSRAIRNLLALEPQVARLVTPDGTATVAADAIAAGETVEVRPGERIPADGVVLEGSSTVDEATLTGEATPRGVAAGAEVAGGSLNGWGLLRVHATRVGADTAVAGIIRAVQEAVESKAPIQGLADRAMGWFVPGVLAVATIAGVAWALAGAAGPRALLVGVTVVVIACPCAIGLATPVALAVAVGEAALRGVFFRSGGALERAALVRRVVFDKTGTLTDGRLGVAALYPGPGWSEEQLLALAASAESGSEHALGRGIVREAERRALRLSSATGFRTHPGGGVEARVESAPVLIGSPSFLCERGVAVPSPHLSAGSKTLACVARAGRYVGAIAASDRVRTEATDAVSRLSALGVESWLLSGDRDEPAHAAALAAGIPAARVRAGLGPREKAGAVAGLRQDGTAVAMVGDGVNDAPALAAADVGFALGTGTDVALEAADVALRTADLAAVPEALALARRARRIVRQNLGWAMGYNVVAIPLAAAGVLHPIVAAGAMALSSVSVLANSLRLARA